MTEFEKKLLELIMDIVNNYELVMDNTSLVARAHLRRRK